MSHSARKKQPSVIEITRFSAGSERRSSTWWLYSGSTVSAVPMRTRPSPAPSTGLPTTFTNTVLAPGRSTEGGTTR
ncbi:hypothetical protein [Variovorax sp. RCC_210]|uniref:hypothetical protein n=1 Tax=Variovorax sp. RCC_210 TaxID=3239217 RepID=UPI00352343CF